MNRYVGCSIVWAAMAVGLSAVFAAPLAAQSGIMPLLSEDTLMVFGLTRSWASQANLDRTRDKVESVVIAGDAVYVQSARALVHAMDAVTGRTIWHRVVGNREYPTFAPAANEKYVAVVNGTTLFVLEVKSGRFCYQRQLTDAPSGPPAIAGDRVFLVMMNGMIASYELPRPDDEILPTIGDDAGGKTPSTDRLKPNLEGEGVEALRRRKSAETADDEPWTCRASGIPETRPVVTDTTAAWTTTSGILYVADLATEKLRFEFVTAAEVTSSPAYRYPLYYVGSRDKYVYAVDEVTGNLQWKFYTSGPVMQSPVVIDNNLFALPRGGGMYCLDATSGAQRWWAPQISQFVAASPGRIYAADDYHRIHVLDRATGLRIDTMGTLRLTIHPVNLQDDRVYLGTTSGLLQCVNEEGLSERARHPNPLASPGPPAGAAAGDKPDADADANPPAGDEADEGMPADEGDEPDPDEDMREVDPVANEGDADDEAAAGDLNVGDP